MVYCGKPSTGCQNCKSRRIKCDETRPHCQNCIRTHRTCPGFPAQVDLMFKNENPGVPRKIRRTPKTEQSFTWINSSETDKDDDYYEERESSPSTPRKRKRSQTDTYTSSANNDDHFDTVLHLDISQHFTPSIEAQATTSFLQNYVFSQQRSNHTQGYLDAISMLFDQATHDSPLYLAIEAVAISILASTPEQHHWSQIAARSYGHALAAISTAIQDPSEATSDATLLSILLFALYESLTLSDQSLSASAKHIEGAVAITKARGTKQFSDPRSLLLFRSVRTQMLANAVRQRKPIDDFPGPQGWLSDMTDTHSSGAKIISSSLSLPNLLSTAETLLSSSPNSETTAQVLLLLDQALEIQHAFSQWETFMPSSWAYSLAGVSHGIDTENAEGVEAWPGPIHRYQDVQVASIRNNHRVDQIFCSSTIVKAIKWLYPHTYHSDLRYVAARDRVQTLVDEICYSVPFIFQPQLFGDEVKGESPSGLSNFGCHLLTWPLHAVSCMQDISPLQRTWLQGRLHAITARSGTGYSRKSSSASSTNVPLSPQIHQYQAAPLLQQDDRRDSSSTTYSLEGGREQDMSLEAFEPTTIPIDPELLGLANQLDVEDIMNGTYDLSPLDQPGWMGGMTIPETRQSQTNSACLTV